MQRLPESDCVEIDDEDMSGEEETTNEESKEHINEPDQAARRELPSTTIKTLKGKKLSIKSIRHDHPKDLIIGNIDEGMNLRTTPLKRNLALLSTLEPKTFDEAVNDECWKFAMKEELDQIEKNGTWELVPRPEYKNIIDTKWIYRNKMDENGKVIRSKARLVCQGYAQMEGIDFDETFYPVVRMELILIFLAFSCYKNFKVY